jgi:hypothetical protein
MIKVLLTKSIGITNAIHNISPRGNKSPEKLRNRLLALIVVFENLFDRKAIK